MSQTATILPKCAACCVSLDPFPPTPMQAMFSTSFGPTPPAHPCRPLANTPNPATEAPYRNDRRLVDGIMAKFSSHPGPRMGVIDCLGNRPADAQGPQSFPANERILVSQPTRKWKRFQAGESF